MNKLGAILLATTLTFSILPKKNLNASEIPPDKKKHFCAGALISSASYFLGPKLESSLLDKSRIHPMIWGTGMAALAGAGKEIIYDKKMGRGYPEKMDFYYTVLGGIVGSLSTHAICKLFKYEDNLVHLKINPKKKETSFYFSVPFN